MRCAVGSGSSGRHSRGRRSTYDEQAQQGQKQHACCTQLQSILVRNRGLGTARFAELAAGAGVRACGVPSHAGGLPTNTEYWRMPGRRKMDQCRILCGLGGGLIGALLSRTRTMPSSLAQSRSRLLCDFS